MKQKLNIIIVFCLFISFFVSCEKFKKNNNVVEMNNQAEKFNYTNIRKLLVPVYNEKEELEGYLLIAKTDICGSDCEEHILFLHTKNGKLQIQQLPELTKDMWGSLGFDMIEMNKSILISEPIYGTNEGHFGCHRFKIKKIKFINNNFVTINEYFLKNRYAFDAGDAQGKCKLYPGIQLSIKSEPHLLEGL